MTYSAAIDDALAQAMSADDCIVFWGEDVQAIHRELFGRFGERRVWNTPISESAFVAAGVTAAMAGLRPVVEVSLVDFLAVAADPLLNHAAKTRAFSGDRWNVPMVVRSSCGGGYGDGGQHQQSLWGWFAHIPGLSVIVPSNPADAGGLLLEAIRSDDPVLYLEHKLLSDRWLDVMGRLGRTTVSFDIPDAGRVGTVPATWEPIPVGSAAICRPGSDVTIVSVGVGVHRSLQAAEVLDREGIAAEIIDLRTVQPIDRETVVTSASHTGYLIVVDEDYEAFGLSGEVSAVVAESCSVPPGFARVCTRETIPFSRSAEALALPSVDRIVAATHQLLGRGS